MVKFVGFIDFQVSAMKMPFGEKILEHISPNFEHYSRFFKFVVSFKMDEYSIRNSFRNNVLHC